MRYVPASNPCTAHSKRGRSYLDDDSGGSSGFRHRSPFGRGVRTVASEVHELLLTAQPQRDDANLIKAAEIAEKSPSALQKQTVLAIRKLREAIEYGASADEREQLLLMAIRRAEAWATD
jgi:hypothetical protein